MGALPKSVTFRHSVSAASGDDGFMSPYVFIAHIGAGGDAGDV
jgi:hypothetical protein